MATTPSVSVAAERPGPTPAEAELALQGTQFEDLAQALLWCGARIARDLLEAELAHGPKTGVGSSGAEGRWVSAAPVAAAEG